jgi:predicted amidohydrolase
MKTEHPTLMMTRLNPQYFVLSTRCLICIACAIGPFIAVAAHAAPPNKLKIGVAQLALEPTLAASKAKIASFIRQARDCGCRVVVFPETSLFAPPGTPAAEIDAAVTDLQKLVDASDLYALIGGVYQRDGKEKPFERLLVIDPEGRIVQTYNKMWYDARFQNCPGLFEIDGVPCAATICADRWIRSVEDLPAAAGAKILFEVSNNYADEWLSDLGWFWYVPRAVRNQAFVVFANTGSEDRAQLTPGHGHSAVISPDGKFVNALDTASDQLMVAELDLLQATGGRARARASHPAFKPFWQTGIAILRGQQSASPAHQPLVSPQVEVKIAAAQIACSVRLEDNLQRMIEMVGKARMNQADVVVFPELCITGADESEIVAAKQPELESAIAKLQTAAREAGIHVVFGLPWNEQGKRQNCAVVIGPEGKVLTRYAQLVVDRPELFTAGTSTKAMWFEIKGVPCVVTIGRDSLWSEIAEMAAWRGAQVHLHLAYDRDTSPEANLLRSQLWVNLASFRTFTATVNAASPASLPHPSAPASGGSAIWDDYHRGANRKLGGYGPYSAVRVAEAKQEETILYGMQIIPATNPQFGILTSITNAQMTSWYATGARAIYSDLGDSNQ